MRKARHIGRDSRARLWLRVTLAGPLVLAGSVAAACGATLWWPPGAAGINHLVLPMILLPAVWIVAFLHACLDRRLWRAWAVHGALLCANAALIAPRLAG